MLLAVEVPLRKFIFRLKQHELDPALYYGHDQDGVLCIVLVVHVDDLLIGVSTKYPDIYAKMKNLLP